MSSIHKIVPRKIYVSEALWAGCDTEARPMGAEIIGRDSSKKPGLRSKV